MSVTTTRAPRRLGSPVSRPRRGAAAHQAARRLLHVSRRQVQQPFALKEGASVGPAHGLEKIRPLLQGSRQTLRGVIGKFGRGAIDDNHGEVVELRKGRFEGELSLPPFQPLRDQLGGIGRHRKVLGNEEQRREREARDREQHNQGMSNADRDNAADRQDPGRQNASQERVRPSGQSRRDRQATANGQHLFCNIHHAAEACGAAATMMSRSAGIALFLRCRQGDSMSGSCSARGANGQGQPVRFRGT